MTRPLSERLTGATDMAYAGAHWTSGNVPKDDRPFPLARTFLRHILPALFLFVVALAAIAAFAASEIIRTAYLEFATRRAEAIADGVARTEAASWAKLLKGEMLDADGNARLTKAFADEVEELGVIRLKVYDLSGRTLFSSLAEEIGRTETGAALKAVLRGETADINQVTEPDGAVLYELYVPMRGKDGNLHTVFELYEPVTTLDALLTRTGLIAGLVPGSLLVGLMIALWLLVHRAQEHIDSRTRLLIQLRQRLETFVSADAVRAAREAGAEGAIESRVVETSILYSDVRRFTSYAEGMPPDSVVRFLNETMAIQIEAVTSENGDVDKMIGDAMLARFDGPSGPARAIRAGCKIAARARTGMTSPDGTPLPRGVGVGVFTGPVIAGVIGPKGRRDFTVIGDSVNIAARLCSGAAEGEVVADADTVETAGATEFGPVEVITVKGRKDSLRVRRIKPAPAKAGMSTGEQKIPQEV